MWREDGLNMAGSIMDDLVNKEKKKKKARLKKKREQERLEKERLEAEKKKRELEENKLELEKQKLKEKRRNRIPFFKSKVQDMIDNDVEPAGSGSLPESFTKPKKNQPPDDYFSRSSDDTTISVRIDEPKVQAPTQVESEVASDPAIVEPKTPEPVSQPTPPPAPQVSQEPGLSVRELIDMGTKEQLSSFFSKNIRASNNIYLPGIDPSKFKFPDYGYRRLIEHMIEDKNFLRILIDVEEMQGVMFITLSSCIRSIDDPQDEGNNSVIPAEATLRGLESLSDILHNNEAEMDPFENDWKHLNALLECFVHPDVNGRIRTWEFETEKTKVKLTSNNTGNSIDYSAEIVPKA